LLKKKIGQNRKVIAPARVKEIIGSLKREKLLAFFAANPQERTGGAGHLARELRSLIKERETRLTWKGMISPRRIIRTAILTGIASAIFVGWWFYTLKNPPAPKVTLQGVQVGKPEGEEEAKAPEKSSGQQAAVVAAAETPKEETVAPPEAKTTAVVKAKSSSREKSGGSKKFKQDEELNQSASLIFKLLLLPLVGVIIAGSLLQRFGPQLWNMLRGTASSKSR